MFLPSNQINPSKFLNISLHKTYFRIYSFRCVLSWNSAEITTRVMAARANLSHNYCVANDFQSDCTNTCRC